MNSTVPNLNETDCIAEWEPSLAAALLFFPVFPSILAYILFWYILYKYWSELKNIYFIFASCLAISNLTILFSFGFYGSPSTYYGRNLGGNGLNVFVGSLLNFGWFSSLPMYQIIAVNRFISIRFPAHVQNVYSKKNCFIMILVAFIYGLCNFIINLCPCCHFLYYFDIYTFAYDLETNGAFIFSFVDLASAMLTSAVCFLFNSATLIFIRKNNQTMANALNDVAVIQRAKREKRYFILFFINSSSFFIFDLVATLANMSTSRFAGLIVSCLFIFHLLLEIYLNLFFNGIIRKRLFLLLNSSFLCKQQTTMALFTKTTSTNS